VEYTCSVATRCNALQRCRARANHCCTFREFTPTITGVLQMFYWGREPRNSRRRPEVRTPATTPSDVCLQVKPAETELKSFFLMTGNMLVAQQRDPLHRYRTFVRLLNYGRSYILKPLTLKDLERVDPDAACRHFSRAFLNPAEFTLCFVGALHAAHRCTFPEFTLTITVLPRLFDGEEGHEKTLVPRDVQPCCHCR
jgi:hypothetical protein